MTFMATKLVLFAIFISFSSLVASGFSLENDFCSKTPYPEECKRLSSLKYIPKSKSEFRNMVVKTALDMASKAQTQNKWESSKCRNDNEKAAWADCLKLFEDIVYKLNYTTDPYSKCDDYDVQTWLSAALTDYETCKAGFSDLGVSDYVLPYMSTNVSKVISTILAMNKDSVKVPPAQNYKEGFPHWVTAGDRKLLQTSSPKADLVVAQDGSGNFRTIKAALDAAAKRSGTGRFVIYIKRGIYQENLEIGKSLKNIMLVGDGLRYTIITGSRSVGGGFTTFNSATVAVTGSGFIARGITFRNTAGPQNHQAVALRSGSDFSVFYHCGFEGYQDTLYVHSQRQFYRECYIYGTVDFIFGNAAVVLQDCMIYGRRPMDKQKIAVTAQGRSDPNQNTGIVIQGARISPAPDLAPVVSQFQTFLGRPWKEYSRTVFMQCYMDSFIDPAGWLEWSGDFALDTLYYGEYQNFGPGSSTSRRVQWRGYRVITNPSEASKFTVENFIGGRSWLPGTGVRFWPGL